MILNAATAEVEHRGELHRRHAGGHSFEDAGIHVGEQQITPEDWLIFPGTFFGTNENHEVIDAARGSVDRDRGQFAAENIGASLMKGDRWNQSSCGPSHCPDVIRPAGSSRTGGDRLVLEGSSRAGRSDIVIPNSVPVSRRCQVGPASASAPVSDTSYSGQRYPVTRS